MGRRRLRDGPYEVGDEDEDGLPRPITLSQKRQNARLERLEQDGRVITAARIGAMFGTDPVAILEERRALARLVRLAAHNVAVRDENRRNGH